MRSCTRTINSTLLCGKITAGINEFVLALQGKIDDERYAHVRHLLDYQTGHLILWRDAINGCYCNLSGIPDSTRCVDRHPWRMEAGVLKLNGHDTYIVSPFETVSGSVAIVTGVKNTVGTATTTLDFSSASYDLATNYVLRPVRWAIGLAGLSWQQTDRLVSGWTMRSTI